MGAFLKIFLLYSVCVLSKTYAHIDTDADVLGVVEKGFDVVSRILDIVRNDSANADTLNQIQEDLDRIADSLNNFFTTNKLDRIKDIRDKIDLAKADLERYLNKTVFSNSSDSISVDATLHIFLESAADARSSIQGLTGELLNKLPEMDNKDIIQIITDKTNCHLIEFNNQTVSLMKLLQEGIIVELTYLHLQKQDITGEKQKWMNQVSRVRNRISELETKCYIRIAECLDSSSHAPRLVTNPLFLPIASIVVVFFFC